MSVSIATSIRVTREARGRVSGDNVELAFGYWPGRGAPVVALHGITANYLNFIGIAERLAGRRPLLALDLRGRGDSDKPQAGYGFAQHARDVAAAVRAFDLRPSVIAGHSMGAYVAAALAAQDPELVAALVLIDGGYVLPPTAAPAPNQALNAALAERIRQLSETYPSRDAYRAFWKTKPNFPPEDWGPWVEAFLDYEVGGEIAVQPKASQGAVLADLAEGLKTDEILNRLRTIHVPVLLVRAETGFTKDQPPLFPDAVADQMRSYLPQLEDRKIPGTTHYTIVLGDRGASEIAYIIDELAERVSKPAAV